MNYMMHRNMTLLALPVVIALAAAAHASDWPQFRGPGRDGVAPESGWLTAWPKEGPARLWKARVGTGSSGIVVRDGRAYSMGFDKGADTIVCLNAETGEKIWSYSYPSESFDNMHEGGPGSTPSVDAKSVFALGRAGQLHCLEADTGKKTWTVDLREDLKGVMPMFGWAASPLLLEDRLILPVGGAGVGTVALDKTSGRLIWKSGDDDSSYASPVAFKAVAPASLPAAAAGGQVAIFNAAGVLIVNASNGAEFARHEWVTPSPVNSRINAATPIVGEGTIFIGSGYGKGCAMLKLGAAKLEVQWQNEDLRPQYASCVRHEGFIYGFDSHDGGDSAGELKCLDARNGAVKWARANPGRGTLALSGGKLIIASRQGELILAEASPDKYTELARTQAVSGTVRAEPVLAGGRIYVRGVNGEVVCFDAKK